MKRSLRFLMLFAVAATAFVSCSNDQTESSPESPKYSFRFTANTNETDTRTDFGSNYAIKWQKGDQVGLYIDSTTPTANAAATVDETANPVFFLAEEVNAYKEGDFFYAYYPYSETATSNFQALELAIPATQSQNDIAEFNGSYNPLVGVPAQTTGSSDTDAMEEIKFRQTAAMIEFTPYSSNEEYQGEKIVSIAYTNEGEDALAGSFIYDLSTVPEMGEMPAIDRSTLAEASKNITVTLADGNMSEIDGIDGKDMNPVYMSVIPGTYMGSLVVTTDKATYTFKQKKELELPRAYVRRLALDLANAERTTADAPKTVEDGKYAIIAYYETNNLYAALSSVPNSTRLSGIEVTDAYDAENQLLHSNDATLEWTITYTTEGYTISNGEETYLTAGDKKASTTQTPAYFNITEQENGTYRIDATTVITADKTYGLRYNATSKYFAFYGSDPNISMIADMHLVPVAKDTRTQLATPEITSVTPEGKNVKIVWNKVDGAGSYTISFEPAIIGPQTYEADATAASFTQTYEVGYDQTFKVLIVANPADPTANTASEAAVSKEVATETDPNADENIAYVKVTEALADWTGKYIIAHESNAMNSSFTSGKLGTTTISISNSTSIASNTTNDKFAIEIAKKGNNYTLKFANTQKFIGYDSSTNAKIGDTASDNSFEWSIKLQDNGTVLITNVKTTTRFIGWNGTDSFKVYSTQNTGTNAQPVLYKLNTDGEGGGETPTPEPSIVKVDPESLSFAAAGESKPVTVTTANADGCTIDASVDNAQFSAEVADNTVTVTADANETTAAITGTLTINLMKDGVAVATKTVALSQDAKSTGEGPSVGTILWSEDWTGGAANDVPSKYTQTGTTVYNGNTVIYTASSTNTKLYNENLAGGTAPELLLSKSKQTWTITGIPINGVSKAILTMKANNASRTQITYYLDDATTGTSTNGITATINNTSGAKNLKIVITNTSGSNVRLDDIELKVAE